MKNTISFVLALISTALLAFGATDAASQFDVLASQSNLPIQSIDERLPGPFSGMRESQAQNVSE